MRALGLRVLYHHVSGSLQIALAAPPRSPGDWSMEPVRGCPCALCAELSKFLRDRDRVAYSWPLAEERRKHVHDAISRHSPCR